MLKHVETKLGGCGKALAGAGEALLDMFSVMDDNRTALPDVGVQRIHDSCKRYLRMAKVAGVRARPKAHLLTHLVQRPLQHGSSSKYATMADEGYNAVVASLAKAAHRAVWEVRALEHFENLSALPKRKRGLS